MSKKNNLVIILLITSLTVFSQKTLSTDYDYSVSKPYKVVDARSKEYFSNSTEVLSVKVKANKNQVLIQKYDVNSMVEIGKEVYNDLPKNFLYEGVIEAQDKYYFFYSSWTGKKTKHERLFYREIDFDKGTFNGDPKQIINHDGKLAGFYSSVMADALFSATYWTGMGNSFAMMGKMFSGKPKFNLGTSTDGSKIIIKYRKKPKVRKDTKSWDILGVNVFDSSMSSIWSKEFTMPYTERRMDVLDHISDNSGKVFILAKVFHDDSNKNKKKRRDKNANYHIEFFELNASLDKIKISKINLEENKFINDIVLVQSGENELICSGFYSSGLSRKSGADGIFTYKIDIGGKLLDKNYYEIPLEIINQYAKKRTQNKNAKKDKKGKAEVGYLQLNQIFVNEDGSITLVGETSYVKSHHSPQSKRITYTFYYENILVSKINANGELAWMKKIPKRQRGVRGKGGMSYNYFFANGNHYLVYLDNVKNFELSLDKIPALHMDAKGGYLTSMKIDDATGKTVKGSVLDFRQIKGDIVAYQFNTDRIVKIKENEFFVEVYKKKKEDIFLKVEIKN